MSYLQSVLDSGVCPRCQEPKNDIDEQYSFGVYAGVFCTDCAMRGFTDGCGHNAPMGTRAEYEADNGPGTYDED